MYFSLKFPIHFLTIQPELGVWLRTLAISRAREISKGHREELSGIAKRLGLKERSVTFEQRRSRLERMLREGEAKAGHREENCSERTTGRGYNTKES